MGAHTLTLVDDTYNANPDSVQAAIDVLAALPGPRLLVLGLSGVGSVLVKGSRFMKMEQVVQAIVAHAGQHKEAAHAV